jgi:hypothetical protein
MEDELLCRMICNPLRINKKSNNNQNYDGELLKLIKRKYPEYIINLNDLNHIYNKIEEINKINLINELVENTINGAISGCIGFDNKSDEVRNIEQPKKKIQKI